MMQPHDDLDTPYGFRGKCKTCNLEVEYVTGYWRHIDNQFHHVVEPLRNHDGTPKPFVKEEPASAATEETVAAKEGHTFADPDYQV